MRRLFGLVASLLITPVSAAPVGSAAPNGTGLPVVVNGNQTTVDAAFCNAVRAKPALRIVANRGQWPINTIASNSSTTNLRFEASYQAYIGEQDASDIRLAFTNTQVTAGGDTVLNLADYTLGAALNGFSGSKSEPLFIGGSKNPTINVNAGVVITDPSGLQATAGQSFTIRAGALLASVSSTSLLAVGGRAQGGTGFDKMVEGPAAQATQVYNNTTVAVPSGGIAAPGFGFAPVAVLGYPAKPMVSLILFGDSITWGQGDTNDTFGNSGALGRGTWQARSGGTLPLAYANVSRSGDFLYGGLPANSQARWALMPYATHVVFGLGNNDIGTQSLATMQANALSLWRLAKRQGLYVAQTTATPRTTSTVPVVSLTASGTTVTATVASTATLTTSSVTIAGASPAAYNGTFAVTVTGPTTFTYTAGSAPGSSATGTITWSDNFGTVANQTVVPGWESSGYTGASGPPYAGIRGAWNAWLQTQVGVVDGVTGMKLLDAVYDFDALYRDATSTDKWSLAYGVPSADGIHPDAAVATVGGNFMRPIYAAYKPLQVGCQ